MTTNKHNNNIDLITMPPARNVVMTQQQLNALLNGIIAQVNAANAARVANPRNNAATSYAVPPEQLLNPTTGDMEDSPLGKRF